MMADLETAEVFDLWSGLWLLSTAIGRRIIVNRPRLPIHLNVYCIFVGESGWPRKSTAISHALRVARGYLDEHATKNILVTDASTPAAMVQALVKSSNDDNSATLTIAVSELVRFLGREAGGTDLPGMLTDLYDCPELVESPGTIARGPTSIRNAYVTFLSASTPAWLHRSINVDVISGGFTSRIIFIYADKGKGRIPWPSGRRLFNANRLVKLLHTTVTNCLSGSNGKIELEREALATFSNWYTRRSFHRDDFRASFESREDEHVLRLAALLCINRGTWTCSEHDIRNAISIIEHAKKSASNIFETNLSRDRTTLGIQSVLHVLSEAPAGGIKQSELASRVRHRFSIDDLKSCLSVLKELQLVRELRGQSPKGGRPHTRWVATARLNGVDIGAMNLEEIVEKIPLYHKEM